MPKHEEFFVYFWISVFSMSKRTDQALAKNVTPLCWGNPNNRHSIVAGIKHE
jgi:hypothetical protein